MHGDQVVPFEACGVSSGRTSFGLRNGFHVPGIEIEEASTYLEQMEKNSIAVDMESRKNEIWNNVQALAKEKGGEILQSMRYELLDEVTNLVEYPTAILGTFKEDFLKLPKEILVTVMKKLQLMP